MARTVYQDSEGAYICEHVPGVHGFDALTWMECVPIRYGMECSFCTLWYIEKERGGVRHPLGIQLDRASPNLTIFVSLLGSSSFFAFWMPTTISGACTLIPSLQRLWGECRCFSFLRLHMLRGDSSLGRQPAVVLRTTQWCTPLQKV